VTAARTCKNTLKNLAILASERWAKACAAARAPRRPGQRNCHLCHAEANRRYRASVKQQNEALKRIEAPVNAKV
jgi:hypothetical protein